MGIGSSFYKEDQGVATMGLLQHFKEITRNQNFQVFQDHNPCLFLLSSAILSFNPRKKLALKCDSSKFLAIEFGAINL